MQFRWLLGGVLAALCLLPGLCWGEEPIVEFLAGLRARDDADTALEYLDLLEKRTDLPVEIRESLPYERGLSIVAASRKLRKPDEQVLQLDAARKLLAQFVAAHPRHSRVASAQSELGGLQLSRGKLLIQQTRGLANPAQKASLLKSARDDIAQAVAVLRTALVQYKANYDAFPKQIDKIADKAKFAAREQAEFDLIKAQFDLGQCTYEEAHTYDAGTPEFKSQLAKAVAEFDKIYQQFRTRGAGMHALLFEGKCFQESGDFGKALGIFKQILDLQEEGGKETGRLRPLQDQARHLRLVCLADDKRPDLKGVVAEAEEWLGSANPAARRSRAGLGIQWELVQALEKLAREKETPPAQKDLYLKQALALAQFIHQYAGEYKEPSGQTMLRVSSALKIKSSAAGPKDFDAAFTSAMQLVEDMDKRQKSLAAAKPDEKPSLERAYQLHLGETARTLRLALSLYTPKDSLADLNKARFLLAYLYFELKDRSYEAALLAEHLATRYKAIDDKVAQDAAYLAMAAWFQAYSEAPEKEREPEIERLLEIGNYIAAQWPNTERSNESLMMLGRLYSQIRKPEKAAEFFDRVPESSPARLEAQLAAGLAYWQSYAALSVLPVKERPQDLDLPKMLEKSQKILETAIDKGEAKLKPKEPSTESLHAAKLSLVQILNSSGKYEEAIAFLTKGERALVPAVAADDPKTRPERGVKSRLFASLTYRELLRSYVGTKNVEQARAALKQLEALEAGGAAGLNALLRELGEQLQSEVRRLQQSNDKRLADVMSSFEKFLADLLVRSKDGGEFNMLLWIGETYAALGDGVKEGNRAKANELYGKSTEAYQSILALAGTKPAAVPAAVIPALHLRLVAGKRRQQAFDEAVTEIRKILKQRPQALDVQQEAARIYTDWAARGGPEDSSKWILAVMGDRAQKVPEKVIWGWHEMSERLIRSLRSRPNPETQKLCLEARYFDLYCKYHHAIEVAKPESKLTILQAARLDILSTGLLSTLAKDDADWKRYDVLFREIQTELNKASGSKAEVVGIDVAMKPADPVNETPATAAESEKGTKTPEAEPGKSASAKTGVATAPTETGKLDKPKPKKKKTKDPPSSPGTTILIVLALLAAAGGGGYFYWKRMQQQAQAKSSRRRESRGKRGTASADEPEPVAASSGAEKSSPPAVRKKRPASAPPPPENQT